MSEIVSYLLIVAIFLLLLLIIWRLIKKLLSKIFVILLNGLGGLILFFLIVHFLGVEIPLNPATVTATILFGLPAVGTLLILRLGGLI